MIMIIYVVIVLWPQPCVVVFVRGCHWGPFRIDTYKHSTVGLSNVGWDQQEAVPTTAKRPSVSGDGSLVGGSFTLCSLWVVLWPAKVNPR